jgi:hypothetical protein
LALCQTRPKLCFLTKPRQLSIFNNQLKKDTIIYLPRSDAFYERWTKSFKQTEKRVFRSAAAIIVIARTTKGACGSRRHTSPFFSTNVAAINATIPLASHNPGGGVSYKPFLQPPSPRPPRSQPRAVDATFVKANKQPPAGLIRARDCSYIGSLASILQGRGRCSSLPIVVEDAPPYVFRTHPIHPDDARPADPKRCSQKLQLCPWAAIIRARQDYFILYDGCAIQEVVPPEELFLLSG